MGYANFMICNTRCVEQHTIFKILIFFFFFVLNQGIVDKHAMVIKVHVVYKRNHVDVMIGN